MMQLRKAGSIVEALSAMVKAQVLNDLLEKVQGELEAARQKEQTDLNNFEMLKASLTDEIKFANKEMDEAKQSKSGSEEANATAEGDLGVTTTDLNNDLGLSRQLAPRMHD